MKKTHAYGVAANQIEVKPGSLIRSFTDNQEAIRSLDWNPVTLCCCVCSRPNPRTTYLSTYPGFVLARRERSQLEEWNELLVF